MGAPNNVHSTDFGDDISKGSAPTDSITATTLSTYLSLIQQYLGVFMYDNATWLAERCVAEYPTNTEALYLLGLAHYRSGKPKSARQVLERLPRSNCTSAMLYLSAQCSYDLRDYTHAEESLLKVCRSSYKQSRTTTDGSGNTMTMDEWILQTTPCPVPNGAAGLALLGNVCRKSNRKDRAIVYYKMSLRLDPFLWTSFEALAELGAQVEPSEFFGTHATRSAVAAPSAVSTILHTKTPLQPMETPAAVQQPSTFYPSTGIRQRTVHFETPGLTPIPVNASYMPAETPRMHMSVINSGGYGNHSTINHNINNNENPLLLRRARDVAARNYYPPSPETPVTTVTRSMRYLRGLGSVGTLDFSKSTSRNESAIGGRSLFACENQTSNLSVMNNTKVDDDTILEKPEKVNTGKVQDILEIMSIAGTAYQRLRQYRCKEAIQLFQSLPPRQQTTGWVLNQLGKAYLEMNDFVSAQRCLEMMKYHDPGRMKGLELLSTVYWQLKKEIELSHLAQQAVNFDRMSPEAWCVLGNCFSLQKDHETALQFFGRSLQIDPDFTYTHTLSGYEYMANEDFEKALACFRQALRTDEQHYNAWYGLGAIHHRQEKFDLAEYHFEKAVSLHPTSSILRCNLGIAQYANGKAYQALETLSEAFRLDPRNPQARFQRATIYSALHRPEEALKELSKVRDAAPREATVHFAMGKVLKRLGRLEEAMKCFLTAMDLDPKDNQLIKSAMDKLDEPDIDEETVAAF